MCAPLSVSQESVQHLKISFSTAGEDSGETVRERERHLCVYIGLTQHTCQVSFVLSIKTVCGCLGPPLTFSDLAAPYLALILGSLMVARLVPVMVNMVPPLKRDKRTYCTENQSKQLHNSTGTIKPLICVTHSCISCCPFSLSCRFQVHIRFNKPFSRDKC